MYKRQVTHSFVYPVEGHDGSTIWYLVRHGLVRAALPALAGAEAAIDAVFLGNAAGPPGLEEIDGVLLVSGWFRKHKAERRRVLSYERRKEEG